MTSTLVPNRTAIDGLAEEFSYKDAGVRLKTARDRVKQMVKAGQASESDYAERNRRETALRFVLDAFNGKVDTALGKAKTDNFGHASTRDSGRLRAGQPTTGGPFGTHGFRRCSWRPVSMS